jgi:signal transduction histidine kinase
MPQTPEIGLLEVVDNGVGFDLKAVNGSYETSGSLGMITLRERAELINGRIKIESIPGKGTSVQVAIPLTDRATDFLHGGIHII